MTAKGSCDTEAWRFGAFKSCRIHRIYELTWHMNATTKSLLRVGNSKFSVSLEFPSWGRVSEKKCRMQWTQPKTKDMQRQ